MHPIHRNISLKFTYHFGLIGFPLSHSLSPPLHHAALRALGLDGEYQLYPIQPLPEGEHTLRKLLSQLRNKNLHGLNVTIPYKQTVIPFLDELTPTAEMIGAVNTIFLHRGLLIGENTDSPGFMRDLSSFFAPYSITESGYDQYALILGAGGAARAVVHALLQAGWQITIAARRPEQAHSLAQDLDQTSSIRVTPFPVQRQNLIKEPELIVNTTPLGMHPHVNQSPWPADLPLPKNARVYDLVYNPRETKFIASARKMGLPSTNGLGMLIEQAALAFEKWTGIDPPRGPMLSAVQNG